MPRHFVAKHSPEANRVPNTIGTQNIDATPAVVRWVRLRSTAQLSKSTALPLNVNWEEEQGHRTLMEDMAGAIRVGVLGLVQFRRESRRNRSVIPRLRRREHIFRDRCARA